ncbi:MAG: multidrug ABC transporter substrate-binding protein [Spirochaetaceae bacterium]|nr:multidrug ABC transporter substrate-binding protein [Spirochaetaceae bacterium]
MFRSRFSLEVFIAARYLRGQGRMVLFSLGTRLSFIFMALMVFIMVVVLSVFTGFQKEVHNSLWNSGYHITLSRSLAGASLDNYADILEATKKEPALEPLLRSSFPSISINGLLEIQNRFEGKAIRAIPVRSEDLKTGDLKDFPRVVHYNQDLLDRFDGGNIVIVGREMARYYHWEVGDQIRLFMPRGGALTKGMQVQQQTFTIGGFFRTGYYEFDLNLIFLSLNTAQRVLGLPNRSTEVIFQLEDLADLDSARRLIRESLPGNQYLYSIRTIRDERGNFLAALQLEKTLMVMILGLLILAGVAGIWVTSYLLVRSKSRSIGMLRSMGLPTGSVLIIFTAHSLLIGLLATAVGGATGIFMANHLESVIQLVEDMINSACIWWSGNCAPVHLIPRNIYYFDHLPVNADLNIIFGVALTTMILSGFAGFFPARQAAMQDPVQTIRND